MTSCDRGVEVEDALVEDVDRLDDRELPVEARLLHDALQLAEFENERLLVLMDDEGGGIERRRGGAEEDEENGEENAHDQFPPSLFFFCSWSSGR